MPRMRVGIRGLDGVPPYSAETMHPSLLGCGPSPTRAIKPAGATAAAIQHYQAGQVSSPGEDRPGQLLA